MDFEAELLKAPVRKRKTVQLFPKDKQCKRPATHRLDREQTMEDIQEYLQASTLQFSDGSEEEIHPKQEVDGKAGGTAVYKASLAPCRADRRQVKQITSVQQSTMLELLQSHVLETLKKINLSNQKTMEGSWCRLPDELLLTIFTHLPKSSLIRAIQVCRQWHRVGCDTSLWQHLDLGEKKKLPMDVLCTILQRGVTVIRLTQTQIIPSTHVSFQINSIQVMDLSRAVISSPVLEQLLSSCSLLKKLSLESCTVTERACWCLSRNDLLQVLNLAMVEGITLSALQVMFPKLHKLQSLNISWCQLTQPSVTYLVQSLPPSLQQLNLSGCRENLQDSDIELLCYRCPRLTELDLSDSLVITKISLLLIVGRLRQLEYLALSRCYAITHTHLHCLGQILSLLAVDVFGLMSDSRLKQLSTVIPSIQINRFPFSSIARPTTGVKRTSIWNVKVRDY